MLYLAIVTLLVLTAGSIAVLLGVRQAKDGYENADGFHSQPATDRRGESSMAALGGGVAHLPRQQR